MWYGCITVAEDTLASEQYLPVTCDSSHHHHQQQQQQQLAAVTPSLEVTPASATASLYSTTTQSVQQNGKLTSLAAAEPNSTPSPGDHLVAFADQHASKLRKNAELYHP